MLVLPKLPYIGLLLLLSALLLGLKSLLPNLFYTFVSWFLVEFGRDPIIAPLLPVVFILSC